MSGPLDLIHPRWIKKYNLSDKAFEVVSLPARKLLTPGRFDLFAKLFYVRNRKVRPSLARRVYYENLRALVPLGKEWGKEEEKSSFAIHFRVFDDLIDSFSSGEFDSSVSIVPVGKSNTLMDGAHRISSLAYYGKDVTACIFQDVEGEKFPYDFFITRGMSLRAADLAALEGVNWLEGMEILCVWPGGEEPDLNGAEVFYRRDFRLDTRSYLMLRHLADPDRDVTVGDADAEVTVSFIFFVPNSVEAIMGDDRVTFARGKESVGRLSELVLTWDGRRKWYDGGGLSFLGFRLWAGLQDRYRSRISFLQRRRFVEGDWQYMPLSEKVLKKIKKWL